MLTVIVVLTAGKVALLLKLHFYILRHFSLNYATVFLVYLDMT